MYYISLPKTVLYYNPSKMEGLFFKMKNVTILLEFGHFYILTFPKNNI